MSQQTCPNCGVDKDTLSIERKFETAQIGDFSLAGGQMKTSARVVLVINCENCGWTAQGCVVGRHFVVNAEGVINEGRH